MAKNKTELGDLINDVMTDLIDYADDAIQDERDDAYATGYRQGRFEQRMDTSMDEVRQIVDGDIYRKTARDFLEESRRGPHPTESELTPQERRDEIVEQAKADIESLKGRCRGVRYGSIDDLYHISDGSYSGSYALRAKFVINKHKRTVVVLMYGAFSNKVRSRGIAKCAPDDCFNAHIGKAIALRRALRFEVPDEYIYTPQPTEVRVGDVVVTTNGEFPQWGNGVVKKIASGLGNPRGYFVEDGSFAYLYEAKIIDDTRKEAANR